LVEAFLFDIGVSTGDKVTCVLLPVWVEVGIYNFRVQVINSNTSNQRNPWNIVAHVCTVDTNDSPLMIKAD